jgi:hypothetical protein
VTGHTALTLDGVVLNTTLTAKVPVGARFTLAGETTATVHIVTARTQAPGTGTDEQQTITLTDVISGNYKLTFEGTESANIAFGADAAAVKAALVALDDGYVAADFTVTGSAGTAFVVTFGGALAAAPQTAITGVSDVGSIAVVRTRPGLVAVPTSTTTAITFTPALGAGTYADDGVLTFQAQELDIKVGDGNITASEKKEYEYLLDRGDLDTVREGKQVPLEIKLECVFEHITTGTSEEISPMDAIKGAGGAAEWVSASSDLCEPYAINIVVLHIPPCGTAQRERSLFADFRAESREINWKDATIAVSGKCNVTEAEVTRE